MEEHLLIGGANPFPLSQLPLEVLAKIVLNLDSFSIGNLVKACPSLSGHFIFLSDGGVDSPGKGLDWLPAHNLDEFLKSHCRGPRVRLSIPGYIRLIFVYDPSRINLILSNRGPETPEEDLFMTLLNERSIVYFHQWNSAGGYGLAVYNLRKRRFTVGEPSATWAGPPYCKTLLQKSVFKPIIRDHTNKYLYHVRLRFENCQTEKRRRLRNICLSTVRLFVIEYIDVLPIFSNCSIGGSRYDRRRGSSVLIITHLGAEDPYRITPLSPVNTRPGSIEQSGFNDFVGAFRDVRINGGPNSLLHELDFSETHDLYIKQASLQCPEEPSLPHEIYAPNIWRYGFESIFPNTNVPRIEQEEGGYGKCLGCISIIAHRSGLSFNQALDSWPLLQHLTLINYKDVSSGDDSFNRKSTLDSTSPNTVNMSDLPTFNQLKRLTSLTIHGFLFNGDVQKLQRARSNHEKFVLDFAEPEPAASNIDPVIQHELAERTSTTKYGTEQNKRRRM